MSSPVNPEDGIRQAPGSSPNGSSLEDSPSSTGSPSSAGGSSSPEIITQAIGSTRAPAPAIPELDPHLIQIGAYEGPLDLLLDLVRKQQIDIYDIPIAKITDQYLAYLKQLEEMDLNVEGEFLFMAATLIHIKSRMLLPVEPGAGGTQQEDPRTELVYRLLEHEKFKNAAQMLRSKRTIEEASWSAPGIEEFEGIDVHPGFAVKLFDLTSAFHQVVNRMKLRKPLEMDTEEVSVAEMMERIKQVLTLRPAPVPLEDFFLGLGTQSALIALFLALLEMVRLQAVRLFQKESLAPITVHKNKRFNKILEGSASDWLERGWEETHA